jgi:hypothetical protein
MEELLRNDFTTHYHLPFCAAISLIIETEEAYFEIEDTKKEIILHTERGRGMANFSNPSKMPLTIVNYDKFMTSLDNDFQRGKDRCDIIVNSKGNQYFILAELKDSPNIKNHRKKAKKQLLASLATLVEVEKIKEVITSKTVKKCCYFNKQSKSPQLIEAVKAFNRLATGFTDGFQMSQADIEAFNFEFWEYTGEQTLTFTV